MSQYMTGYVETLEKLNEAKIKHIAEMKQENAELREDKERLDWLAENTEITIRKVISGFLIFEHNEIIWPEDRGMLRARIDAARKEAQQ